VGALCQGGPAPALPQLEQCLSASRWSLAWHCNLPLCAPLPHARAAASLRPHAYLRCTRSLKLRAALSSVLSQLQGGGSGGGAKRKRAAGYAAPGGSEATLIADLQALCGPCAGGSASADAAGARDLGAPAARTQLGRSEQQPQPELRGQQQVQRRQRPRQWLVVLDDVHHLLMADDAASRPGDGAPVLRGLLQVRWWGAMGPGSRAAGARPP
jgi:hypothetical protein